MSGRLLGQKCNGQNGYSLIDWIERIRRNLTSTGIFCKKKELRNLKMAYFMKVGSRNTFQMKSVCSLFMVGVLIVGQMAGGAWVWALDGAAAGGMGSMTSHSTPLIAGLRGEVTLFQHLKQGKGTVPQYRQTIAAGDVLSTGQESVAEILFPQGAGLVTVQEFSEASVDNGTDGKLRLTMTVGEAEISSPLRDQGQNGPLLLATPNLTARTQGGLITIEVKSTVAQTASQPNPSPSYLHRVNLTSQMRVSSNTVLSEKFCVKEGTLDIDYHTDTQGVRHISLSAGECAGFSNGLLSDSIEMVQITDWRAICAVNPHCEIPESIRKYITKKQMGQALALEQALIGEEKPDAEMDELVILATTGLVLAAAAETVIVPGGSTGSPLNPCLLDPEACAEGTFTDVNPNPVNEPPLVGGGEPQQPPAQDTNIQNTATLMPQDGVAGGAGSLLYTNSDFLATKELLLVTNNPDPDTAPHKGKVPQTPLVISTLTPVEGFNGVTPTNEFIPPVFPSFDQIPTTDVQLGIEGGTREQILEQLAQWLRSPFIDPDDPLQGITVNGAGENCATILDCAELIWALGQTGTFQFPGFDAGIDGSLQASSPGVPITLKHGVTLVNTTVTLSNLDTLGDPTQTSQYFSQLDPSLGVPLDGSLMAILGEPGNPALVSVEDRLLGILANSRVQPQNDNLSTSLLAVLDSELRGPTAPPVIGQDGNGQDITRVDIPALVELLDSDVKVMHGVVVASSASGGQVDQALLEATAPLMAMIRGAMETSSDFGRVAGQEAKLVANLLPGDSLIRVDASSLTVNGNLFSVTGGGQFMVNGGSLLSVQGNSLVSINGGVFVSVGSGSLFSLNGGGLVNFGTGQNAVTISNSLCSGGGCFAPFSNPAWLVAGNPSDFSAAPEFSPFLDLGSFADGSVNSVNIAPGSAILEVQPGGTIHLH